MRTVLPFLLSVILLSVAAPVSALTVGDDLAVMDDLGVELHLERPARRVISLSPHLTELMYSIGAGDRLAGVVRGSDFPLEAAALPEIGDASGLDFERIVHSRPDLILAWGSGNRSVDIARLRVLGLRVLVLEPQRLEFHGCDSPRAPERPSP